MVNGREAVGHPSPLPTAVQPSASLLAFISQSPFPVVLVCFCTCVVSSAHSARRSGRVPPPELYNGSVCTRAVTSAQGAQRSGRVPPPELL